MSSTFHQSILLVSAVGVLFFASCDPNTSDAPSPRKKPNSENVESAESSQQSPESNAGEENETTTDSNPIWNQPVTKNMKEQGKTQYRMTCSICHGRKGKGDGPAAGGLEPKPRDFTRNDGQWMNQQPNKRLFQIIKQGGRHPDISQAMPAHRNRLTDQQIRSIVWYIRKLSKAKSSSSQSADQ